MSMRDNKQLKAVVIIGQGFEDEEVIYPVIRLREAGIIVDIATKDAELVIGRKGFPLKTLTSLYAGLVDAEKLETKSYDFAVIPGGFEGPDRVRQIKRVLEFLKKMNKEKKIIAAMCHGPWVLISAGILKNKKATCYAGIVDDVKNAGAEFVDEAVVVDGNIITSRHPRDIGDFMKAILTETLKR